jgi:hypothetical protein
LSWYVSFTRNIKCFEIERSTTSSAGPFTKINSLANTATTYTDPTSFFCFPAFLKKTLTNQQSNCKIPYYHFLTAFLKKLKIYNPLKNLKLDKERLKWQSG